MAEPTVERNTYSAFERLLYIFLIPLIFVTILLGVLLSLFDYDVMNSLLRTANKVPLVEKVIPDPKPQTAQTNEVESSIRAQIEQEVEVAEQLNEQLLQTENELKMAIQSNEEKDRTIEELRAKIAEMEEQAEEKALSDEEYRAQIQQLAGLYADMMPSKAAPIMENLTLAETVLILSEMKTDARVAILEKMDPQRAAEASIHLKDVTPAKDLQIAALQERLELSEQPATEPANAMTENELGQTFAAMVPKSAATILMEMNAVNPAKVISILSAMDSQARGKVLAAISDSSTETAADISAKLAQ